MHTTHEIRMDAVSEPEAVDKDEIIPRIQDLMDAIDAKRDYLEYRLEQDKYTYLVGRAIINQEFISNIAGYIFFVI